MAKIADLVRRAQDKYEKAQKDADSVERMRQAITTISDISQIKGKVNGKT